jgi:hypothetical protein
MDASTLPLNDARVSIGFFLIVSILKSFPSNKHKRLKIGILVRARERFNSPFAIYLGVRSWVIVGYRKIRLIHIAFLVAKVLFVKVMLTQFSAPRARFRERGVPE